MRWSKPHCNFIAYPKLSSMAALTRFRALLLQGSSLVSGATRDRAPTDNEEDQSFSREEGQREEQTAQKQQMPAAWSVQPHSGRIPGSTRDPREPRLAQLCNFRLWGDEGVVRDLPLPSRTSCRENTQLVQPTIIEDAN